MTLPDSSDFDQAEAGMRMIAGSWATMYLAIVAKGVPADHAIQMIVAYITAINSKPSTPEPPKSEEDE